MLADRSQLAQKFRDALVALGDGATLVAPEEWLGAVVSPAALSGTAWWPAPDSATDDSAPLDIVYLGGLDSG